MLQLLTEREDTLDRRRKGILAALKTNAQVVVDVIPELELIVGHQPDVPHLDPVASRNRFNLVLRDFVRVFCQSDHPLVLFMDDLQWVDASSLELVESLMTDNDTQFLLLIGAYRQNEVGASHPLPATLDTLRNARVPIEEITLRGLDLNQVTALAMDTLHKDEEAVLPLAQLIENKTAGNPFFLREFMRSLYMEKLLVFEHTKGGWQWNLRDIRTVGITDNVVDLMCDKIRNLSGVTQEALEIARVYRQSIRSEHAGGGS